jgi:hypothetical protein
MKKVWIVLATVCLLASSVLGVMAVSADDIVYGDADGNGKINNRDLGLLLMHLNDAVVDIDLAAMDVYYDGKINNRDLGLLLQYLNDADVTLGPEEPEGDDNIFNDTELDWS